MPSKYYSIALLVVRMRMYVVCWTARWPDCPTLLSRVRYFNYYWLDWQEAWYGYSGYQRMIPNDFGDVLTFPVALKKVKTTATHVILKTMLLSDQCILARGLHPGQT